MANIITGFRIAASLALLFCPVFSLPFYAVYLMAGISDMVDGVVARRTNTASEFGARLDTAADFVFAVVCLIRLLPVIDMPTWLYVWIGVIALIKGINIVSGYMMKKRLVAVHTVMNKVTGALLFVLPLTIPLIEQSHSAIVVCAIATFAAIQEGHLIRTGDERSDEV
jgi:CDP-diacylglycerol--glycerol-3-phosphate 3-phosphatidyltransferase